MFGLGHWWTIFSAGWLHGGLIHIVMNLLWVRQLAPVVADVYGPGRAIVIYVISSAVGFTLSSVAFFFPLGLLRGAQLTVGASAPIFGLLGALVCYGRMGGSSMINSQAKSYALMLFLFGLIIPGVDNFAHAGGFVGGYLDGPLAESVQGRAARSPDLGDRPAARDAALGSRVRAHRLADRPRRGIITRIFLN